MEAPRKPYTTAELRRFWTLGKAALIHERKHGIALRREEMNGLINGTWKPDVTTEELTAELVKDPFSLEKCRPPVPPPGRKPLKEPRP